MTDQYIMFITGGFGITISTLIAFRSWLNERI